MHEPNTHNFPHNYTNSPKSCNGRGRSQDEAAAEGRRQEANTIKLTLTSAKNFFTTNN